MKHVPTFILAIVTVFAPIQAALATVMVLIIVDLATGIAAAKKRKEAITSSGLKRTVIKFFIYETALILAFLCGQYLIDILPVVKIVSTFIGLTELKSCYENLNEISGGDLLKQLISKLNVGDK